MEIIFGIIVMAIFIFVIFSCGKKNSKKQKTNYYNEYDHNYNIVDSHVIDNEDDNDDDDF